MDFQNSEFLKTIIEPNRTEKVFIINSKLNAGTTSGAETNYLSNIIRLTIVYEKDGQDFERKFIIKSLSTASLYDLGKSCGYYDRETKMYSKVLPKMAKLLHPNVCYPMSYKSIYDEVLILEDLKSDGYVTNDRMKQLDFTHATETLKLLARFHAASVKLEKMMDLEDVKSDLWFQYKGKENPFTGLYDNGFDVVAEILKVELPEYGEKFEGIKESVLKATKSFVNKNGFRVLNHGDFHMNNVMFKYDQKTGDIINAKIFDFQFSRWCSPVADIHYFLTTSLQFDVFKTRSHELLSCYIKLLNEMLGKYGCEEKYELEDIKKDFEESWVISLYTLIVIAPLVLVEPSDPINLDEGTNDDGFQFDAFRKGYSSDKFKQVLFKWIGYYHEKGYF